MVQGKFDLIITQKSTLNEAECNLGQVKRETMLASSISQGLGAGLAGVSCRGRTWFTVQLQMSSHSAFDSSHRAFYSRSAPPLPLVMVSMW